MCNAILRSNYEKLRINADYENFGYCADSLLIISECVLIVTLHGKTKRLYLSL